jgi:hypothetical protein
MEESNRKEERMHRAKSIALPIAAAACPEQPTLKLHAISSASNVTGETNNLIPVNGSPPLSLPPLQQLAVDQADIEYVSTTTGACPTGTSPPLCGLSPGNG